MLSALIRSHGGIDCVGVEETAAPVCKPGEALVRIHFSALNHLDLFVLRGMPGMSLPLPIVPGSDFAGVVEEIRDDGNSGIQTGDSVAVYPVTSCGTCESCLRGEEQYCRNFGIYGETQDGGHCQYKCVPVRNLVKLPSPDHLQTAAAGGLTFLTVYEMLFVKAGIRKGMTVLVLGANSGIGAAAIQLAKYAGCEVIATAGDDSKAAFAVESGADHVVNHYENPDWYREVRKITNGRGADIAVEHPGQATFQNSMKSLAAGGTLVTCGAGSGYDVSLDLRHLFIKQQRIIGSTMGSYAGFESVIRLLTEGKIKSMIHKVYPLADVKNAYITLEKSLQKGKILLDNL